MSAGVVAAAPPGTSEGTSGATDRRLPESPTFARGGEKSGSGRGVPGWVPGPRLNPLAALVNCNLDPAFTHTHTHTHTLSLSSYLF